MRLSPRLLSLVAGSAALTAVGCGGTQTLARAEEPIQPAPQPTVAVARRTPNNTNPTTTPDDPGMTPVSQPYQFPEDVPVDCGRG